MVRILRLLIKTQVRGASWRNRDSWVTREPPVPPDRRELLGLRERKDRRDSLVILEQLGPPDHRELPDLRERKDPLDRRDLPGLRDQSHWEQ
jgi:hypothetical protein